MTGKHAFRARALLLAGLMAALPAASQAPAVPGPPNPAPAGQQEPAAVREEEPLKGEAPGQDRALMLRVGASAAWDSNVFRLPEPTSDRIATASVGLHFDQPYAQQRFLLDVTETAYRYDRLSRLNFDALQYRAAWAWHLGPRVSGTLAADRAESLVSYADFRSTTARNVRTAESRHLNADAWLFGGWHLLGGLKQVETRYSVPFPQEGDQSGTGIEAGVRNQLRSGSALTLNARTLDARYDDRPLDAAALLDDGYRRSESEVLATWVVSAKTSLDARLARVAHRSNHFGVRDFTDTEARLGSTWAAGAKLDLQLAIIREVQPWSDNTASYRVNKQVAFGPAWRIAPRTVLRINAAKAQSDYRGAPPGFAGAPRRDLLRTAQLTVDWRVLRNLTLNAALQRQRQASSEPSARFSASTVSAGVSFAF